MYAKYINIPANTLVSAPLRTDIDVAPCIVKSVDVVIPSGCVDLVLIWVDYRSTRLYPTNEDGYFRGNDTQLHFNPNSYLDNPPYVLSVYGVNNDEKYQHGISIYFDVEFITSTNELNSGDRLLVDMAVLSTHRIT